MKILQRAFFCHLLLLVAVNVALAASPVRRIGAPLAPSGLDGRNIALWHSHGYYYNIEKGEWLWQRAHLMQTIEDLYTASYVIDLLAPMLENAGAYVMMPRERDLNSVELLIDMDSPTSPGYSETDGVNLWTTSDSPGFRNPSRPLGDKENPFSDGTVRSVSAVSSEADASVASWNADVPHTAYYTVYISYASLPESSSEVVYTVNSLRGEEKFAVDQTMGGGTWIRLGEFPLAAGISDLPIVTVSNIASGSNIGKIVTADAVKIGGGLGNVARGEGDKTSVSKRQRWMEGARYWMQWAGVPDSVYSCTDYQNDYTDDFGGRPRWVNYLAGGSSRMPRENGLRIPIDLSFALHTDAGVTADSAIVGTLGIYSTNGGSPLGDGRRRGTNRDLTESIVNSIVDDVRALHEPNWTKRKTRDRKYAEARIPQVPSALVELLSHQNFADMRYGHDPRFRFDVARAIYKGMLRYLWGGSKKACVVQPLPVNSFAINNLGNGSYRLTWKPTKDPLEASATPRYYIVEKREPNGVFRKVAEVNSPQFDYKAAVGQLVSFRIVAANDGGVSFPSEALSLCYFDNHNPEVLIVNGFTRISAPDWFDADSIAGFLDEIDFGVPYVRNIAYSGSQYDFSRSSQWVDDVVTPGFGASASNFDGRPVAGNTFDYPTVHGEAIAAARYPFISASLGGYLDNPKSYKQPIIDLILGKQKEFQPGNDASKTSFKAFPAELQKALESHTASGGGLLFSGEFLASDLFANPFSNDSVMAADTAFARRVLNIDHETSFAAVSGYVDVLPDWTNDFTESGVGYSSRPNERIYVVGSPDAIVGADEGHSATIMRYQENGRSAAVASRNGQKAVIAMGFPFESIFSRSDRSRLMRQVLNFLTNVKRPISPPFPALSPIDPSSVVATPDVNHSPEIIITNEQ